MKYHLGVASVQFFQLGCSQSNTSGVARKLFQRVQKVENFPMFKRTYILELSVLPRSCCGNLPVCVVSGGSGKTWSGLSNIGRLLTGYVYSAKAEKIWLI